MSYDLGVWHSSKRPSAEEAGKIYRALCKGDHSVVAPHDAVLQFYQRITRQSPEINTVPEKKVERSPFSDMIDVSEGHAILNLSWGTAPWMLPIVFRLAAQHGLLCFDPQSYTVHMPGDPIPERPPNPKPWLAKINAEIAVAFAPRGFKATKLHLSKRSDGFHFKIRLEDNSEFYRPAISVESNRLLRWRREHGSVLGESDRVASGWVDELLERTTDLRQWALTASTDLHQTALEIITYLETWAVPFFARFDNLPALCAHLCEHDYPHIRPAHLIDFLLCFGGKELAEQLGRRLLLTNSRIRREFPVELEHYRRTREFTRWPSAVTPEEMANATDFSQIADKMGGLPSEWTQNLVMAAVGYGLRLE